MAFEPAGSIDNSRLHFESSLLEHCGPPFLRPTTVRQCAADAAAAAAAADSAAYGAGIYSSSGSSSWFLGGVRHGPPALPPAPPTIFLDRRSPAASSLFDRECACVPVEGFQQGYERESCGCQGGRTTSARVAFTVVYHTPELGVIVSSAGGRGRLPVVPPGANSGLWHRGSLPQRPGAWGLGPGATSPGSGLRTPGFATRPSSSSR